MEHYNHIHEFIKTVVPATCKEHGYTLYKCECGCEHKDTFTPFTSHDFALINEVTPTCTEAGQRNYRCTTCCEEKAEVLDPLKHSWDEWKIQKFPTCTEQGNKIRICTNCGQIEEKEISATKHKLTSPKKSQIKKRHVDFFCSNCGQTVTLPYYHKIIQFIVNHPVKAIIRTLVILVLIASFAVATVNLLIPFYHFSVATVMMEKGKHTDAYFHLIKCRKFEDSRVLLKNFKVVYDKKVEIRHLFFGSGDSPLTIETPYEYEYDEYGNIVADRDHNYSYEFDNYGNVTTALCYYQDGRVISKSEYDKYGSRTLYVVYDEYGEIYLNDVSEYKYEFYSDGNITLIVEYDEHGNVNCKKEYDKFGNIILSINYDENGDIDSERNYNYSYDFYGNVTHLICYDSDGEIMYKQSEYEYDKYGNITCYTIYYPDNSIDKKYEFKYTNPRVIYSK